MSKNKKQHFIPRFYLKYFSFQNDNKTIGIFVTDSMKYIPRGNLRYQCYCDYFYGKDLTLEKELADLEDNVSGIISQILNRGTIPKKQTDEYRYLLLFVISLLQRTRYAADTMKEMANKVIEIASKGDPQTKKSLDDFKLGTEEAPIIALSALAQCCIISSDLNCKLLFSSIDRKFVTSDNPVVKHNQYYAKEYTRSHVGLAAKGLQILLNINPDYCLMFYDNNVYRVGNRRDSVIKISNPKDIDEINIFQFINADQVLYFDHSITENYIKALVQDSQAHMKKDRIIAREYKPLNPASSNEGSLIHALPSITRRDLNLSFVKITKKAKTHYPSPGDTPGMYRDPELLKEVDNI